WQGQRDIDGRADIFALGVILFRALTAQYPFADKSYPLLVLKICRDPAPRLTEFRTDLPPQIQTILDRFLAKDREDRFRTCLQAKAALEPFGNFSGVPELVTSPPNTAERPPPPEQTPDLRPAQRSGIPPIFLLGGGAFALLTAIAFFAVLMILTFS